MNLSIMKSLSAYEKIYACIGRNVYTRDELTEALNVGGEIKSRTTISKYVNLSFDGKLPMVTVKDGKVRIEEAEIREFVEELCTLLGTEAEELFATTQSVTLKKNKEEEYQALLSQKDQEIQNLRTEIQNDVAKGIVTEMDKKPIVLSSIRSVPAKVFHRDYFLENPKTLLDIPQLVSKYGGERPSFYCTSKAEESGAELTTKNYCSRIAKILFKSKFLEHRLEDEERIAREYDLKRTIYENRLESIQKLLDEDLGNQMKLSLYAGFYEYRGTEMESLLNYAGAHCIEANYVIKLLENPMEFHNYENIRGFLRQACEASEARMKREAARELIAGDWYVVAEYNGKPCRFQMMPVNELLKFRKALSERKYGEATVQLEQLLGTKRGATFAEDNPDNILKVEDMEMRSPDQEYYKDAIQMIHEVDDGE